MMNSWIYLPNTKIIFKFITDAKRFYIVTIEGGKPRVRPFAFVMEHKGKICFTTSNQKDVYKQLVSNPYFEICTMSENGQWIRLQGKAVLDPGMEAKVKAFEVMPGFTENPIFALFYVEEGEATIYSFTDGTRTITL